MQEYLTQPVALLIDEDDDVKAVVQQFGYRYFTSEDAFKHYVEHEVLELEPVGD